MGQPIDHMFFFHKGAGMLTRRIDSPVYGRPELDVALLPEGSFFGELPGIINI